MKITKYGIMFNSKILGFATSENSGGECVSVSYELDDNSGNMWLVDTPEHAEWVRQNTTPWYNAEYDSPKNSYVGKNTKVIKFETEISNVEVKIPSFKEVMLFLDKIGNENGHSYFIDNPKHEQKYSIYDLYQYLGKYK